MADTEFYQDDYINRPQMMAIKAPKRTLIVLLMSVEHRKAVGSAHTMHLGLNGWDGVAVSIRSRWSSLSLAHLIGVRHDINHPLRGPLSCPWAIPSPRARFATSVLRWMMR